jgi:hypothetical protein
MRYAVPAGSVYYCRINNGNLGDLLTQSEALKSISDFREKEGFGLYWIGKLDVDEK